MTPCHYLKFGARTVFLFAFLLFPFAFASAQNATATLSGTVEDQNRAVVPGATVKVINLGTGLERETTTNDSGDFTIPLLPPSTYTVRVERDGFATVEISNVVLNVGDQKALLIQLRTGSITEMVKVTTDAPLINESPAVSTTVDRQFVGNIPLNGRSFQALIALTPGTVLTRATGIEQGQFSVNGQRADANYFTVDGVSANIGVTGGSTLGQGGGGALPGLSASGGTNNLVSVDALQEFKIQTSTYAPEFGRTPGGQVSIVTRSGTNEFHGTLFEYFRNDALDANDWFNNSLRLKRPALRQNDFGGVLGGPVLLPRFGEGGSQPGYNGRNHTFFFFSYEGLRLRQPTTAITDVPSLTARRMAPAQLQPYLNAFPLPTGPDRTTGFAEFAATFSNPVTLNATSFRIDHAVNEKLTLFGRYNYSPSNSIQRGAGFTLNTFGVTEIKTETLTGGVSWNVNSKLISDFRLNWSRHKGASLRQIDGFGGAVPLSEAILFRPPFTSLDSLYTLTLGGGAQTILRVGSTAVNTQRQANIIENLTLLAGSHQLKFGVDYRRLYPIFTPRLYSQSFNFSGMGITGTPAIGSVFSGRLSAGTINGVSGTLFPVFTNFSAYAQDTWKITGRLALTYGLRWELNPAPTESNGNQPFAVTQPDNLAALDLAPRGRPLYETTYGNFAPRVGFSYQAFGRQGSETVLRGGFGIFYDLGTGSASGAFSVFPFIAIRSLTGNPAFPIDPALAVPPAPDINARPIVQLNALDPGLQLPRTYQWNFAVEQSLGSHQTLSASYVGAAGRRLLRMESISNPNPRIGFLNMTRSIANSDYRALQLQFHRRLSSGLQALLSYTWSKSLDTVSDDSSANAPAERLDPQRDRGPSNFDIRHVLSSAITYNLPAPALNPVINAVMRGWAVDTIFNARSATPVNVVFSRDIGFGSFSFRPDLVPGVPLYVDDPTAPGGKRINNAPVAGNPRQVGPFFVPTEGRQGNLERNALRGFPLYQLDLAIRRQFNFTERLNLQVRAEFFNIFNHPNFADPANSLGSVSSTGTFTPTSSFGRSQSMLGRNLGTGGGTSGGLNPLYQIGGPRSIQFGIKLQF
ncbi:MAG TPA: TonB-dependent receptor [Pyrinomonadaceae bacterium]|nr:TonB-dependent receptor [Pyrinomonadaceae bacterium]